MTAGPSPADPRAETELLTDVDLPLPDRRDGKVRSSWSIGDGRRVIVTTDRLSAFDRVIAAVAHKGQVLNELSAWWFRHLADVVDHHLLDVPDPNVSVVVEARPLPVEVVVRGRITGVTDTSLWTRYAAGVRDLDGHRLPDGLRKNDALPSPVITPTTKAEAGGHDVPIAVSDVPASGLVEPALWRRIQDVALALFDRGAAVGSAAGLVLADTKYEFGIGPSGELLLIDEVHTPDSSRWWVADGLDARLAAGEEPVSLDKEVVRRAFAQLGYRGDGPVPELPAEVWAATSARYVDTYERLTGQAFVPGAPPAAERIIEHLRQAGIL